MASNDIKQTFSIVKVSMVFITLVVTGVSIWVLKTVFDSADEVRDSVYVVDSRNTLKLALAEDATINRAAEAEALVKRLHELLFILSPDIDFINSSVESAEYLGDNSVHNYCNSLKETGFYNSLVANGVSTEFVCDSVSVSKCDRGDFKAVLYGKTSMVYSDKIVFKNLVTECFLSSCVRDALDPQGFLAEDWKVVRNDEIGVVDRSPYAPAVATAQTDSITTNVNE